MCATRSSRLKRHGEVHGYAVYRHRHEPLGRVTLLVDLLADPDDVAGLKTLLRWVDRAARAEDADKVRRYAMNGAFRRALQRNGYFAREVDARSQREGERRAGARTASTTRPGKWHITYGDSDQDQC